MSNVFTHVMMVTVVIIPPHEMRQLHRVMYRPEKRYLIGFVWSALVMLTSVVVCIHVECIEYTSTAETRRVVFWQEASRQDTKGCIEEET